MRRGFAVSLWVFIAAGIVGFLYLAPSDRDISQARVSGPPPAAIAVAKNEPASATAKKVEPIPPLAPRVGATTPASAMPSEEPYDPTQTMIPLKRIVPGGQPTPAAALQTLVWAVLKQSDVTAAACFELEDDAREKAEAYLASLPEAARARYRTPDHLVALFFAHDMLNCTALQILDTTLIGNDTAILTIRTQDDSGIRTSKIPFRAGSNGWALSISAREIEELLKRVARMSPE